MRLKNSIAVTDNSDNTKADVAALPNQIELLSGLFDTVMIIDPVQKKVIDITIKTPTRRAPKISELTTIRCYLVDLLTGKYKATGVYSVQEQTIKVLTGAVFSTDVSSTLRYSLADYQRRTFIKEHCSTKKSIYTLKEDYLFDSVDTAALYVMGQIVDGFSVWITVDGKSLREIVE